MNGMILYPTNDDILVLKEIYVMGKWEEAETFIEKMSCFIETWNLRWWQIVYNLKPLKINETVLG
jgi:hypothetical protein